MISLCTTSVEETATADGNIDRGESSLEKPVLIMYDPLSITAVLFCKSGAPRKKLARRLTAADRGLDLLDLKEDEDKKD